MSQLDKLAFELEFEVDEPAYEIYNLDDGKYTVKFNNVFLYEDDEKRILNLRFVITEGTEIDKTITVPFYLITSTNNKRFERTQRLSLLNFLNVRLKMDISLVSIMTLNQDVVDEILEYIGYECNVTQKTNNDFKTYKITGRE